MKVLASEKEAEVLAELVEALLPVQARHPRLQGQHEEQDGGHRGHGLLLVILRLEDHLNGKSVHYLFHCRGLPSVAVRFNGKV